MPLMSQTWAGLPAGSLVTNMFAKDLDAGENGTVTFSLLTGDNRGKLCVLYINCGGFPKDLLIYLFFLFSNNLENDGQGHFEINSERGDIRTTELFNLNTQPYYTLKIGTRDGGLPPLEEEAVIYVQV